MNTRLGSAARARAAPRTRTLDSHACRLRNRLSNDTHRLVINVWGVGYQLMDDTPAWSASAEQRELG